MLGDAMAPQHEELVIRDIPGADRVERRAEREHQGRRLRMVTETLQREDLSQRRGDDRGFSGHIV